MAGAKGAVVQSRSTPASPAQSAFQVNENTHTYSSLRQSDPITIITLPSPHPNPNPTRLLLDQVNENTHTRSSLRQSGDTTSNHNHYHATHNDHDGTTMTGVIPVMLTGTSGGGSNLEELDRIDGEELLLRDLEASAGVLLSSSSASSSSAQTGQVGMAAGQGLAKSPNINANSGRNSGTRASIDKTAQRRAQV